MSLKVMHREIMSAVIGAGKAALWKAGRGSAIPAAQTADELVKAVYRIDETVVSAKYRTGRH